MNRGRFSRENWTSPWNAVNITTDGLFRTGYLEVEIMNKLVMIIALAIILETLPDGMASAAPPRRTGRPSLRPARAQTLSPYLNLLNDTQSLEQNYLMNTVPQQAIYDSIGQLQ